MGRKKFKPLKNPTGKAKSYRKRFVRLKKKAVAVISDTTTKKWPKEKKPDQ